MGMDPNARLRGRIAKDSPKHQEISPKYQNVLIGGRTKNLRGVKQRTTWYRKALLLSNIFLKRIILLGSPVRGREKPQNKFGQAGLPHRVYGKPGRHGVGKLR